MIFGGQIIVNATPDHGMDRFKELAVTQGERGSKPIKLVEARGAGSYFPGGCFNRSHLCSFSWKPLQNGSYLLPYWVQNKTDFNGCVKSAIGWNWRCNESWMVTLCFESLLFAKFERRGCELPVDQLARGR